MVRTDTRRSMSQGMAFSGVRDDPGHGEAFTMLTTEPGPDVAPYHGRQVAVLRPDQWKAWLTYERPAGQLLGPAPAGTLEVSAANAA